MNLLKCQFLITKRNENWSIEVDTGNLEHKDIAALLLGKEFDQASFPLKGLVINGSSHGKISGRFDTQMGWSLKGRWNVSAPSIQMPDMGIHLLDTAIDIPILLSSSDSPKPFPEQKEGGNFHIGDFSWNKKSFGGFDLSPSFSENTFSITSPMSINLWEGKITISNLAGKSLTLPTRSFHASIGIEGLNIASLLQDTNIPLSGMLDAEIPSINYKDESIACEGALTVKTMGGVITVEGLSIEKPFSRGRKIRGSLFWEGIRLDPLTEKIPIGKMSGVIRGKIEKFEMEYGEPSKFIMEVESVKQKGVKQKISVDAISNLSLIGTGSSGVSLVLNSGLNKFFSYYPYSRIWFQCTLENDIFSLRGLIHKGGKEYLITRGLFSGVDIINQNPDNKISFKDMQERMKRVFEETDAPVVK